MKQSLIISYVVVSHQVLGSQLNITRPIELMGVGYGYAHYYKIIWYVGETIYFCLGRYCVCVFKPFRKIPQEHFFVNRKELTSSGGPSKFEIHIVAQFDNHNSQVWRVSWNITGTVLASSGDDGCVRLWKGEISMNNYVAALKFSLRNTHPKHLEKIIFPQLLLNYVLY